MLTELGLNFWGIMLCVFFQWIDGWFRDSVIGVVQTPVNPLKDAIFLDGRSLSKKAPPKFYFALHKPKGLVSVHLLVVGPVLDSGVCEFCLLRLGFQTETFTAEYEVRLVLTLDFITRLSLTSYCG
jgi:hypothetical protein